MNQDGARVRIAAEVVDKISPANVEECTERYKRAEPDDFPAAPIEDSGCERAALTYERNTAWHRHRQVGTDV